MRAIRLEQFVQPADITISQTDLPKLQLGDVLVRVVAAGVNPSDVKYAAGIVPTSLLPRTPGRDFAGIIEHGPDRLLGREVFGTGGDLGITRDGTHAEYLALPLAGVSIKPDALTVPQAAAVGVPFITAYKAVIELTNLQRGETILIIGGSGSVGTAASQMAKWLGAKVIATTQQGDKMSDPTSSADQFILLPDQEIDEVVMDITEGKGVHVVLNAVGGYTFDGGVRSLGHGGRMVCISAQGQKPVSFDLMHFYKHSHRWYGLDTLELTAVDCAPILDRLHPGFESGAFKVDVAESYPLEQASTAYQRVKDGGAGKVVLMM